MAPDPAASAHSHTHSHDPTYLLGDHVADLGQEVLAEQLIELALPQGRPLPEALSDPPPLLFRLAQEPPRAVAWPLGPWTRWAGHEETP